MKPASFVLTPVRCCGFQPVPVVAISEMRSFKKRRETEALHAITRAAALSIAASGSRLPEFPNVYVDVRQAWCRLERWIHVTMATLQVQG